MFNCLNQISLKDGDNSMSEKLLYSAKELKAVTGFSQPRVYKLMHDPNMPVIKVGGRLFMHREKFQQWLAQQSTPEAEKSSPETVNLSESHP